MEEPYLLLLYVDVVLEHGEGSDVRAPYFLVGRPSLGEVLPMLFVDIAGKRSGLCVGAGHVLMEVHQPLRRVVEGDTGIRMGNVLS